MAEPKTPSDTDAIITLAALARRYHCVTISSYIGETVDVTGEWPDVVRRATATLDVQRPIQIKLP